MTATTRLGVDIGGTTIKARLTTGGTILGEWRTDTPPDDPDGRRTVEAVSQVVATAARTAPPDTVGVVSPGIVDEAAGVCVFSANLGWRDLPIQRLLEQAIGRPIGFGHDVRTAAIVEGIGAGAGAEDVVAFIPLGTGVSAAFTRGSTALSLGPLAGEIGQYVLTAGPLAGHRVEQVCSATGIAHRAGRPDGESVARGVRDGEATADRIWRDAIEVLADAIAWISATIAPRIVILGGGLSRSADLLLAPVTAAVRDRLPPMHRPQLRTAIYGASSAVVGALYIGRSGHA